jgi:hypothetical protein
MASERHDLFWVVGLPEWPLGHIPSVYERLCGANQYNSVNEYTQWVSSDMPLFEKLMTFRWGINTVED